LILGLAISIPMIIAGAALIMMILDRMPILVWLGAALLGWIGGQVIATDPAIGPRLHQLLDGDVSLNIDTTSSIFGFVKHLRFDGEIDELVLALFGATIVLVVGSIWRRRKLREMQTPAAV
jgi:predicted tellurium resistance membrane protein TerC